MTHQFTWWMRREDEAFELLKLKTESVLIDDEDYLSAWILLTSKRLTVFVFKQHWKEINHEYT